MTDNKQAFYENDCAYIGWPLILFYSIQFQEENLSLPERHEMGSVAFLRRATNVNLFETK